MSRTGAPPRTAAPRPTRPTLGPPALTAPALTKPSMMAGGAKSISKRSPPSTRFWICGAVLKVLRTRCPLSFSNAAVAARTPGSMAPPLKTLGFTPRTTVILRLNRVLQSLACQLTLLALLAATGGAPDARAQPIDYKFIVRSNAGFIALSMVVIASDDYNKPPDARRLTGEDITTLLLPPLPVSKAKAGTNYGGPTVIPGTENFRLVLWIARRSGAPQRKVCQLQRRHRVARRSLRIHHRSGDACLHPICRHAGGHGIQSPGHGDRCLRHLPVRPREYRKRLCGWRHRPAPPTVAGRGDGGWRDWRPELGVRFWPMRVIRLGCYLSTQAWVYVYPASF